MEDKIYEITDNLFDIISNNKYEKKRAKRELNKIIENYAIVTSNASKGIIEIGEEYIITVKKQD